MPDLAPIFGDRLLKALAARGFKETRRYESEGGIAVDYRNRDSGVQLVAEILGTYVSVMPHDRPSEYIPVGVLIEYLPNRARAPHSSEPDAVSGFIENNYRELASILNGRDGYRELNVIKGAIEADVARELHYDRIWKKPDA